MSTPVRLVLAAQVALLVGMGLLVAGRQAFWGAIDEAAHVSYIQIVADHHRLPVLGEDCIDASLRGLQRGYTGALPGPGCGRDFGTASYEAFQPPLAYLVYAPVFKVPVSLRARAYLLRVANLMTMLAAFALLAWFARREFGDAWGPLLALAGVFFVVPGVLVRGAAVSNGPLEILAAMVFLIAAWRAARTGRPRDVVLAGALLGVALETKLTLAYLAGVYVVAAVAAVRLRRRRSTVLAALAGAGCALALVAPWLAFNHSHYGSLTANAQAHRMQEKAVNPTGYEFGAADVPGRALLLADPLPEEWERSRRPAPGDSLPAATASHVAVGAALLAAAVLLAAMGLRDGRRRRYAWFFLPGALCVATMAFTLLHEQFDIILPRYLYPAAPAAAIALALPIAGRSRRAAVLLAALLTLASTVVFVIYANGRYSLG